MSEVKTTSTVIKSTVVTHSYGIGFNGSFFKTFSAAAKLLETCFLFSAFISSLVTGGLTGTAGYAWSNAYGGSFVDAITILGAVSALVLFFLCLFGVWWKVPPTIRFMVECIWCWLFVVFSMTCAILALKFSMYIYAYSSAMSTGVFSCLALVVFSMDAMVSTIKLYASTGHALEPFFGIPVVISSQTTSQRAVQSSGAQMQFNDMNY